MSMMIIGFKTSQQPKTTLYGREYMHVLSLHVAKMMQDQLCMDEGKMQRQLIGRKKLA